MISREDALGLYRYLLGREPESEPAIDNLRRHYNVADCRSALIQTREFIREFEIANGIIASEIRYKPNHFYPSLVKSSENKIAIVAIVKNEQSNIVQMMSSCAAIADYFAILDTGSSDPTVDIVRSFLSVCKVPGVVGQSTFVNFSQARNEALDLVPGDCNWVLMLDADERIESEDHYKLIDLMKDPDIDGWLLPRYNFVDSQRLLPVDPYPDHQKRLFRFTQNSGIRFTGGVHEEVQGINRWWMAPHSYAHRGGTSGGPHIHHFGQVISPHGSKGYLEKVELYQRLEAN